MNILTVDNNTYNLNAVPTIVEDLQYCVLDCTNPKALDYFYIPLIFLESFNAPAVILDIGGQTIEMPMDWSIMIGEKEMGQCEMVPLTSLNDRGFEAFVYNPFSKIPLIIHLKCFSRYTVSFGEFFSVLCHFQ